MPTAIGLWSIEVAPGGDPVEFTPVNDVRITNVALGDELADESARTTLKIVYPDLAEDSEDGEEDEDDDKTPGLVTTSICSLTPGKIEQANVDIVIGEENTVLLQAIGKNTLYLTGNYIAQELPDEPPYGEEDDSDEEDFDLRDVSSDAEMDPSAMDIPSDEEAEAIGRLEEIVEEALKPSKKRARESDAPTTEETPSATGETLSKSQKKKLNKKLKADNGAAVPVESASVASVTPAAEKKEEKKEKKEKKDKKDKAAPAPAKELPGGLKVKDAKAGSGKVAKKGNTVSMRYIGKLENGKIFDQNTKGKPFSFRLGQGEVIKGWDVGIEGMQVGGERLLTIPSALAYGKRKMGDIPANSTLIFEVKLLDVK